MWHSTKRGKSGDDSFIITIMKLTITQKKDKRNRFVSKTNNLSERIENACLFLICSNITFQTIKYCPLTVLQNLLRLMQLLYIKVELAQCFVQNYRYRVRQI